jgi:hypothetical protein
VQCPDPDALEVCQPRLPRPRSGNRSHPSMAREHTEHGNCCSGLSPHALYTCIQRHPARNASLERQHAIDVARGATVERAEGASRRVAEPLSVDVAIRLEPREHRAPRRPAKSIANRCSIAPVRAPSQPNVGRVGLRTRCRAREVPSTRTAGADEKRRNDRDPVAGRFMRPAPDRGDVDVIPRRRMRACVAIPTQRRPPRAMR